MIKSSVPMSGSTGMVCAFERACEGQASGTASVGKMKIVMEDSEVIPESCFPKRILEFAVVDCASITC